MTPTAPTTAPTTSRLRSQLETVVLPWWQRHGVDAEHGGVFTVFDNAGRRTSTDKYTWSQGRWAWLCARLARDARLGLVDLDADEWSGYARDTARFIAARAVQPGATTAHLTTRDGTPIAVGDHGEVSVSVLTDLFAALGLAGAAGLLEPQSADGAERADWLRQAHELLHYATARLAARTAPSEPYPVHAGFQDLAGFMLRLHVGAELHAVDGSPEAAHIAVEAAAGLVRGPSAMWAADDWWEFRPDDPVDGDTLLARHRTPGHLVETAWMLLDAADRLPAVRDLLPPWLPDLVEHALDLGWDDAQGGMLRYVDREGGAPTGRLLGDDRYEALVTETWDTKLWWVHVEAMLAARRFEHAYPGRRFAAWEARLTDYTLATFPDPAGAEWLQVRDRAGQPLDRVVALPVKDPFHIARALVLALETTPASQTTPTPEPDTDRAKAEPRS